MTFIQESSFYEAIRTDYEIGATFEDSSGVPHVNDPPIVGGAVLARLKANF